MVKKIVFALVFGTFAFSSALANESLACQEIKERILQRYAQTHAPTFTFHESAIRKRVNVLCLAVHIFRQTGDAELIRSILSRTTVRQAKKLFDSYDDYMQTTPRRMLTQIYCERAEEKFAAYMKRSSVAELERIYGAKGQRN